MARLNDPALRHGVAGPPLDVGELHALRARVADELVIAARARRIDVDEVRQLGRVARIVDRRLEQLAERADAPTVWKRQRIAAARDAQLNARR